MALPPSQSPPKEPGAPAWALPWPVRVLHPWRGVIAVQVSRRRIQYARGWMQRLVLARQLLARESPGADEGDSRLPVAAAVPAAGPAPGSIQVRGDSPGAVDVGAAVRMVARHAGAISRSEALQARLEGR